jgi:hypothetical protein
MTKSIKESCARSDETTSLVFTSWTDASGTRVLEIASDITFDMAMKDSVDSFPPTQVSNVEFAIDHAQVPLRMAAFPDFIESAAIFAITSGRASNIISKTPIGQLTLSKVRPSSKSVLRVTLPTDRPLV